MNLTEIRTLLPDFSFRTSFRKLISLSYLFGNLLRIQEIIKKTSYSRQSDLKLFRFLYSLLHYSWFHLLFNLITQTVFLRPLRTLIGKKKIALGNCQIPFFLGKLILDALRLEQQKPMIWDDHIQLHNCILYLFQTIGAARLEALQAHIISIFYLLCVFRTSTRMALLNFLSFVAFNKVGLFSYNSQFLFCQQAHWHNLIWLYMHSFPLSIRPVNVKFSMSSFLFMCFKKFNCHFQKLRRCSRVQPIVFPISFSRTTFLFYLKSFHLWWHCSAFTAI